MRTQGMPVKKPFPNALLGETAWAIARTKDHYLAAFYHRVARRRGKKKAILVVAHKLLVIIDHGLRTKKPSVDLGPDYFDRLEAARIEYQHVRRLEQLGYTVTLMPKEVAWQHAPTDNFRSNTTQRSAQATRR